MEPLQRRKFIRSVATASAVAALGNMAAAGIGKKDKTVADSNRFKISLNAYSFNAPLRAGKTDLEKLLAFSARVGFDAVDLTGYYFPGYPEVPDDEYIFRLKRKAHQLGLAISGTGIRNEFAEPNPEKRNTEIAFVKKWIEVAARLGAPVIRIFSGKSVPEGYQRGQVEQWIVDAIKPCAAYGKEHGVIVAMQNHNDFVKTADEAIRILDKVNSEWFGLVLDTGSFVTNEPYSEIRKTTSYAVNWQVKEQLKYQGKTEDMDLHRLLTIAKESTYRGYLPIETLSPGDPFEIVPPFLKKVKAALETVMQR